MKLTAAERNHLNEMIDTQTFYGIPLEQVTQEILEEIDHTEARTLYIVACMLGWDMRDKESLDHFPYEAEEYLKKFQLIQ